MSKLNFYVSAALLTCLVLDPLFAQNRRGSGGGSPSPGAQRREAPSPSTPSRPSSPPSRPSSGSSDSGASRREAPRPPSVPSRPAPSEPRTSRPAPSEPRQQPSQPRPEPRQERPTPTEPRTSRPAPSEPRQQPSQPRPEPRQERPAPTEPRTSRPAPSEPRQQQPSQTEPRRERPSDNGSGTVRRDTPTRPAPTEPRTGQVNPRQSGQTPSGSTVQRRPRDGEPSPTVRRDVNPSTVVRRGVPVERRTVYGTTNYHRPYGHSHVRVTTVHRHVPYTVVHRHRIVLTPTIYYTHLYRNAQSCYYYDWLFCYTSRTNGYYLIDDYPFYVYNGYYHRYSNYDTCNYQLVDTYTRRVVRNYWNLTCNRAYDQCSSERDYWNYREYSNRFACAETYRNQSYAYFNTFNEQDYYVGGYNNSSVDTYYENDYRAPDYDTMYTPSQSQGSMQSYPQAPMPQIPAQQQQEQPVPMPLPQDQDEVDDMNDMDVPEEVSPVLGSMSDLGTQISGNATSNGSVQAPVPPSIPVRRERDTQDY
jgi:hypothetical protein